MVHAIEKMFWFTQVENPTLYVKVASMFGCTASSVYVTEKEQSSRKLDRIEMEILRELEEQKFQAWSRNTIRIESVKSVM